MWTCPKCGGAVEDQFNSCRKCADEDLPPGLPTPRLKLFDYVAAAVMAYLIPCLAVYIQSTSVWWRAAVLVDGVTLRLALWLLVPAAINFLIFVRFLPSRAASRVAAAILLVTWTGLFIYMFPNWH